MLRGMPIEHRVTFGEHLPAIAEQHRFRSSKTLWHAPENRALRAQRLLEVLATGDVVHVPPRGQKTVERATGSRHHFVVVQERLELKLRLVGPGFAPLEGSAVEIATTRPKGASQTLDSDGSGVIAVVIPRSTAKASLVLDGRKYDIRVGGLDPVSTNLGFFSRLVNLGYIEVTPIDDVNGKEQIAAIEEFQCDHQLPLSGEADAATRAQLVEVHGC